MRTSLLIAAALLFAAGCATTDVDDQEPGGGDGDQTGQTDQLVDTDDDGNPDEIDLDCDGIGDVDLDELCENPMIDEDGDGVPEALDLDCDGTPEICIVGEAMDIGCDGTVEGDTVILVCEAEREEL
jgi:hypothetical protein